MISKMFIGLCALSLSVAATLPIDAQLIFDGTIIDQTDRYDAYPVHLYDGGIHKIWFCARSPETNNDGIFYSEKTGSLDSISGWSVPIELFNVTDVLWSVQDGGVHACDPTVIKGDFTYNKASYSYGFFPRISGYIKAFQQANRGRRSPLVC